MDSGSTARHLQIIDYSVLTDYLGDLLTDIQRPLAGSDRPTGASPEDIAGLVFRTISGRRFCYLSRKRSAVYREAMVQAVAKDISSGKPIHFYYDIGGGYHAGINPNELSPTFAPGLGELLIVRQISSLAQKIRLFYSEGIRFTLVIDNLCALLVNDIPLEKTEAFVAGLRKMLHSLNSPVDIAVLVESEYFSRDDYEREAHMFMESFPDDNNATANFSRFLGRRCSALEASKRIAAYEQVSPQTDRNINSMVDGIRMTQRATPFTFPFRPFPGSDSRIQTGELALILDERGRCKPTLVTTENHDNWRLFELDHGLKISGDFGSVLVGISE